jgi:hypothetical protein
MKQTFGFGCLMRYVLDALMDEVFESHSIQQQEDCRINSPLDNIRMCLERFF